MEEERRDQVRDHDYDGIQEFDNRLPTWWIGTFVLTVIFAVYHWTAHHTFAAKPGTHDGFQAEMEAHARLVAERGPVPPQDGEIAALIKDPQALAMGRDLFMTHCLACHGQGAEGGIGPNLTDAYWIHGGKPSQIGVTVIKGVVEKGMPPWGGVLNTRQLGQLVAHVVSLKGSNPPGAKAPQGILER